MGTETLADAQRQIEHGDVRAAAKSLERLRREAQKRKNLDALREILPVAQLAAERASDQRAKSAVGHVLHAINQNIALRERANGETSVPVAEQPVAERLVAQATARAPTFCGRCGESLPGDLKFCPSCGAEVAPSAERPQPPGVAAPPPARPLAAPPSGTSWGKPIGIFAGGVVALVLVIGIALAASSHHKKSSPAASGASSAKEHALSYIHDHGFDADRVQAYVQNVQIDIGTLQQSPTQANVDQLAQDAQTAHDGIDNIRDNFATTTDSGALGDAELSAFTGANDLKNAMGALVAYAGNPNAATLAHLVSQYQNARGEWNQGVRVIWRTAHVQKPPVI